MKAMKLWESQSFETRANDRLPGRWLFAFGSDKEGVGVPAAVGSGRGQRAVSTGQRFSGVKCACYTSPRTEQGAMHLRMRTAPAHCSIVQVMRSCSRPCFAARGALALSQDVITNRSVVEYIERSEVLIGGSKALEGDRASCATSARPDSSKS